MTTPRKIDKGEALMMQAKGKTLPEIAARFDCTPSAVHHALKPIKAMLMNPAQLREFQENQADIMDTLTGVYVQELFNVEKIKEVKAKDAAVIVGIATEKARLLRDKSTSNSEVSIRALIEHINATPLPIQLPNDDASA